MSPKKIAGIVAAAGLSLGLVGMGVGASFTDSGSATENISVGTFGISLSSATPGAVVVNNGNGVHTVTDVVTPAIQSSVAGSAPLAFVVTSTGSIPAVVRVTATVTGSPSFTDALGTQAAVTLGGVGQAHTYNGGLQWPVLSNADLGQTAQVVYTISVSES